MEKLTIHKIPFTKEIDNRLRMLKAKLGVTSNIICRIGFCLSLNMPSEPPAIDQGDKARDISRFTLFGQYEIFFVALLAQWKNDVGSPLHLDELCIRHMNRGASLVNPNVNV